MKNQVQLRNPDMGTSPGDDMIVFEKNRLEALLMAFLPMR
jgi:hypothetical protein